MNIKQIFAALVSDESGQDLVEYALVVALISLGAIGTMRGVATAIGTMFGTVETNLQSAVS